MLLGLSTLLLLVASASVANLLLVRGVARRKEIAVRTAIGASRGRVVRQLLTEALVLSSLGACAGVTMASWAAGTLVGLLSTDRDRLSLVDELDWRMVAFTLLLTALVALMSAAVPAFGSGRARPGPALREAGQAAAVLRRRWSAGKVLVSLQIALAVLLLSGAALFARSLGQVLSQDAGIDRERVLVITADAASAGYRGASSVEYYARVRERLRAMPGVDSAALSWMPPMSNGLGYWSPNNAVDGVPLQPGAATNVYFNGVSPDYFATVGMGIRRGRDIADSDTVSSPRVVVVNRSLARRFFPEQDPIGRHISIGRHPTRQNLEIVGVVEDAKYGTLQEPARSIAYLPCAQLAEALEGRNLTANVRTSTTPALIGAGVRDELRRIDPRVPVRIEAIADRIRESTVAERVLAVLGGSLGLAALILACAGLYALLGYAVSQHTREIGVRLALGASRPSVLWMVQRESFGLALAGVAAGIAAAVILGGSIRSLLFEISPHDPLSLAAAGALMLVVTGAAAFVPARRAATVDPMRALRHDG
jgi:predicted permease